MATLGIHRLPSNARTLELCTWRRARDEGAESLLIVGTPADNETTTVLGAYQNARADALRRHSGGYTVQSGAGVVWMQLSLEKTNALVADASIDKLLNRMVRPLLRALTLVSKAPVNYFGRDWLSTKKQPVASIGFAHDAKANRALVEAIIGVSRPIVAAGIGDATTSYEGKEHIALGADVDATTNAIVDAYSAIAASTRMVTDVVEVSHDSTSVVEPPPFEWQATRNEAIGLIGAGRDASGRLRIGGNLMASRDAWRRLEEEVSELAKRTANPTEEEVGQLVDESLTTGGAYVFGVRSLTSIRDVILEALLRQSDSG